MGGRRESEGERPSACSDHTHTTYFDVHTARWEDILMMQRALAWFGCWLAFLVAAAAQEPTPDEIASQPTIEQAAKLQERDELAARAQSLKVEGKLPEAIEVAQQVLAIEREAFGEEHAEIAGTYAWLG